MLSGSEKPVSRGAADACSDADVQALDGLLSASTFADGAVVVWVVVAIRLGILVCQIT